MFILYFLILTYYTLKVVLPHFVVYACFSRYNTYPQHVYEKLFAAKHQNWQHWHINKKHIMNKLNGRYEINKRYWTKSTYASKKYNSYPLINKKHSWTQQISTKIRIFEFLLLYYNFLVVKFFKQVLTRLVKKLAKPE